MYADDTQIYKSIDPTQLPDLLKCFEKCIDNVKIWMNSNKLKLNENKTEIMLAGNPRTLKDLQEQK